MVFTPAVLAVDTFTCSRERTDHAPYSFGRSACSRLSDELYGARCASRASASSDCSRWRLGIWPRPRRPIRRGSGIPGQRALRRRHRSPDSSGAGSHEV
jgi:hypothetical protein